MAQRLVDSFESTDLLVPSRQRLLEALQVGLNTSLRDPRQSSLSLSTELAFDRQLPGKRLDLAQERRCWGTRILVLR